MKVLLLKRNDNSIQIIILDFNSPLFHGLGEKLKETLSAWDCLIPGHRLRT